MRKINLILSALFISSIAVVSTGCIPTGGTTPTPTQCSGTKGCYLFTGNAMMVVAMEGMALLQVLH